MAYYFSEEEAKQFVKLYNSGMSCQEIKDTLGVIKTVRSIQRVIKKYGNPRSVGDSFRNAVQRGRVEYIKKKSIFRTHRTKLKPTLRYKILERDGFRCVKCGATPQNCLLEVDHIDSDPTNNKENNLQTLCEVCNMGKPSPNRFTPRI